MNAVGGPWYPNRVAKSLPKPLDFSAVWVVGLQGVEDSAYSYNVMQLDRQAGTADIWRVRVTADFGSWEVEANSMTLVVPKQIGAGTARPVQIGALWHSAWDVEQVLQKYCKQMFELTGHPEWPECLMGSGTAVRIDNRHLSFAVHQIREYTPDNIAIPSSVHSKIMSATTARILKMTGHNRDGNTIFYERGFSARSGA